jgi:Zn-dependent metalloprotease
VGVLETREITLKTTPAISRERAYAIAVNDLKAVGDVALETSGTYLEIIPKGINGMTADTLAWSIAVSVENDAESAVWAYTINAGDGSILDHRKVLPASAKPAGQAASQLYPMIPTVLRSAFWGDWGVYTTKAGTKQQPYTLQDPCYGVKLPLPTCINNTTLPAVVGNTPRNGTGRVQNNIQKAPVFSTGTLIFDGVRWHAFVPWFGNGKFDNSDPSTAGADAFIAMQQVSRTVYALFSREGGVNGTDQRLDLFVHLGYSAGGEASWNQTPIVNPSTFSIAIADLGVDNRGFSRTNATAPDILAHECGHGLNRATYLAGVTGPTTGEGMAIEEGNADIFAAIFEWSMSVQGYRNMVPEWIGEQSYFVNWNGTTFTPQVALRYMDNPPRDIHPDPSAPARTISSPACYSATIGSMDQHYANGPYNHLFYLLATGGTNQCDSALTVPSIGYAAAAHIWFEALLRSQPTDGYQQLKARWLGAATAIYGSGAAEVTAVQAAFDGVHVP